MVCIMDSGGNPVSISGASAVKIRIKNEDGSVFERAASTGFAFGTFQQIYMYIFPMTAAETALFDKKSNTLELVVLYGSRQQVFSYPRQLNVFDPAEL